MARPQVSAVPSELLEAAQDSELKAPQLEREHVHSLYDNIADHWSHTRYKPWPHVVEFLQSIGDAALVADVGCGNGKYFAPTLENGAGFVLGMDLSVPLLELACKKMEEFDGYDKPWDDNGRVGVKRTAEGEEKKEQDTPTTNQKSFPYDASAGDIIHIPLRDGVADAAISIAVLHHLSTATRRVRALQEIRRVLVVGGRALVYAWAKEQEETSKRKFPSQDCYVPWQFRRHGKSYGSDNKGEFIVQRYCHMYIKGELEDLVEKAGGLEVEKSYYDKGNWCVIMVAK